MTSVMRIREKGQVTLPLEIRRQLGLREGALIEAAVKDGRIAPFFIEDEKLRLPEPLLGTTGLSLEPLAGGGGFQAIKK